MALSSAASPNTTVGKKKKTSRMPLKKGSSKKVVAKNIKTEMMKGMPQKQAVAVSMSVSGKKKKKK